MVTMKDIARECNVSFSTVSKALNDSPEIGSEKKKLVKDTAMRMGYRPNAAARALKTNRTYSIGVVFEDTTGSGLQHEFFTTVFESLKVTAEAKGYDITFISRNLGGKNDYYEHTLYRNLDGVAIVSADFTRPDVLKLVNSPIPTVTLDFHYEGHTVVRSDNIEGMAQLTKYVLERGHRKIAIIHGESTIVNQRRLGSFLTTCRQWGVDIPDNFIVDGRYHDPKICEEATENLLALPQPPTCIFYPDDFASLGGIRYLQKSGFEIGKDISIVGYDGILLSTLMHPTLVTYKQDSMTMGREMAGELIGQIEHPKGFLPKEIWVKGQLLEGHSVRNLLVDA
ncbi:MAG: LacI family transcriptional regulator [Spirochaetia bacterium]|jgi:LacI family transcriptional regulator|nr:LacI family transcriptional regulator [Spirochaetia bacterium]